RAVQRRRRSGDRRSRRRVGSRRRERADVRDAPDRLRRRARRDAARIHGAAGGSRVKVTRLLHVSVNVEGSLDASRTFYEQLLGPGRTPRPDIPGVDGSWLGLPGHEQLHLVDAPTGPTGIQPTGHHFCVAVDDLDGAIAELEARDIAYKRGAQGDV